MAKHILKEDPLSGSVFVFVNRQRTQMRCLYFEGDGFCIWAKRLEQGRFRIQFEGKEKVCIDLDTLKFIIDGIDVASIKRYKRYRYPQKDGIDRAIRV